MGTCTLKCGKHAAVALPSLGSAAPAATQHARPLEHIGARQCVKLGFWNTLEPLTPET